MGNQRIRASPITSGALTIKTAKRIRAANTPRATATTKVKPIKIAPRFLIARTRTVTVRDKITRTAGMVGMKTAATRVGAMGLTTDRATATITMAAHMTSDTMIDSVIRLADGTTVIVGVTGIINS